MSPLGSIRDAIEEIRRGRMVIVVDDEDRENEGDLICAASAVTPEVINFFARHGRGIICVALPGARLDELGLPQMVRRNTARMGTPFTVSVDALRGTTTGTSAQDRAATVRALISPATRPEDLATPGHIFPLRAADRGVLARAGHTEAALDLARLAGFYPGGVLCEILDEDGSMARLPRLIEFAREHGLAIVSIADLIAHLEVAAEDEGTMAAAARTATPVVRRVTTTTLPTPEGEFTAHLYHAAGSGEGHLALVIGDPAHDTGGAPPLVRVHSQCLTGDVFGSLRCDCGAQLDLALRRIGREGRGVVLYLRQEGREIGLTNKLRAYALQDAGLDTVEANEALGFAPDPRDYRAAAEMLRDLGITLVRLLTNNPAKVSGLEAHGIRVVERVAIEVTPNERNRRYLATKRSKLGHYLERVAGQGRRAAAAS